MQNILNRVHSTNLNFVTPIVSQQDINRDPRWVWIKWSGNHFATRNAAESGVISGRIVLFFARARARHRAGLNGNSRVSHGVKIITGHFILIRAYPLPHHPAPIYIRRAPRKRDPSRSNEVRPRALPRRANSGTRTNLARAYSFYYCEKLFQGSSYFLSARASAARGRDKTIPE